MTKSFDNLHWMLILGMIGEYIGRIYISLNRSPQYVIRETINMDGRHE